MQLALRKGVSLESGVECGLSLPRAPPMDGAHQYASARRDDRQQGKRPREEEAPDNPEECWDSVLAGDDEEDESDAGAAGQRWGRSRPTPGADTASSKAGDGVAVGSSGAESCGVAAWWAPGVVVLVLVLCCCTAA